MDLVSSSCSVTPKPFLREDEEIIFTKVLINALGRGTATPLKDVVNNYLPLARSGTPQETKSTGMVLVVWPQQ